MRHIPGFRPRFTEHGVDLPLGRAVILGTGDGQSLFSPFHVQGSGMKGIFSKFQIPQLMVSPSVIGDRIRFELCNVGNVARLSHKLCLVTLSYSKLPIYVKGEEALKVEEIVMDVEQD